MTETYRDRLIQPGAGLPWEIYTAAEQEKNAEMVWGLWTDLGPMDLGNRPPCCFGCPGTRLGWHRLGLNPNDFHPVDSQPDAVLRSLRVGDTLGVTLKSGTKVSGVLEQPSGGYLRILFGASHALIVRDGIGGIGALIATIDSVTHAPPPDPEWWSWEAITVTAVSGKVSNWWWDLETNTWHQIGRAVVTPRMSRERMNEDVTSTASTVTQLILPQSYLPF